MHMFFHDTYYAFALTQRLYLHFMCLSFCQLLRYESHPAPDPSVIIGKTAVG